MMKNSDDWDIENYYNDIDIGGVYGRYSYFDTLFFFLITYKTAVAIVQELDERQIFPKGGVEFLCTSSEYGLPELYEYRDPYPGTLYHVKYSYILKIYSLKNSIWPGSDINLNVGPEANVLIRSQ